MNSANRKQNVQQGPLYRDQLITNGDLENFKIELLAEFKKLAKELQGQPSKKWLKSLEVRKLLDISPNTLTNLRMNGTLPFTKIGGVIYYDYVDIEEMLTANRNKYVR